jgi:hypothetical protein
MLLINKKLARLSVHDLISKLSNEYEKSISKIKSLCEKYQENELKDKIPPPFNLSRGAIKAVELLNDGLYSGIFDEHCLPNDDVLMIYRLFFLLYNKADIADIINPFIFWAKTCDYFLNKCNGKIGKIILDNISNINFTSDNILRMQKVIGNQYHKLNPTFFSKLCGTTGLFLFLIKDSFEYCGILVDAKKTPPFNLYRNEKYISDRLEKLIESLRNIHLLLKL